MAHVIPGTPSRGRDLALGFIAGALAVVTFHQVMVLILSSVGLIQSRVYAMRGVPPFGVPTILNQMFWGGLWGLLFAAVGDTLPRWPLLLLGFSFGVLGPVLASWFVVAPLQGHPNRGRLGAAAHAGESPHQRLLGDRRGADLCGAAPLGLKTASAAAGVGHSHGGRHVLLASVAKNRAVFASLPRAVTTEARARNEQTL
jgi:hypothetical protein